MRPTQHCSCAGTRSPPASGSAGYHLTYKGTEYPVSVRGLSLGKVGITQGHGLCRGLSPEEASKIFSGNYTSVNADITLAGGHSGVTMKNQNGVQVVIGAPSKGVDLTIGASGVRH